MIKIHFAGNRTYVYCNKYYLLSFECLRSSTPYSLLEINRLGCLLEDLYYLSGQGCHTYIANYIIKIP